MLDPATLAQGSDGSIPDVLVPWLAVVLIVACLGCLSIVGYRMAKDGTKWLHLPLVLVFLSTIIVLGFGSKMLNDILASQDFLNAVAALLSPSADSGDLDRAMTRARSDDDKRVAFDIYSRNHPRDALRYLDANPTLPQTVVQRKGDVQALIAVEDFRASQAPVQVKSIEALRGLVDLSRRDGFVRKSLADGRFVTSSLDEQQVRRLLGQHRMTREGQGIRPITGGGG